MQELFTDAVTGSFVPPDEWDCPHHHEDLAAVRNYLLLIARMFQNMIRVKSLLAAETALSEYVPRALSP